MRRYELLIGVSITVPEDFADEALDTLSLQRPTSLERRRPEVSNSGPGEVEIGAAFLSHHDPPTADRLQALREAALLAATSRLLDPLFERRIPCRVLAWGCTDPQADGRRAGA